MAKEIIVDIKDGVTVTTKGFSGKACQLETADLEKAMGRTSSSTPTAEMTKPQGAKLKVQR